MFRCLLPCLFVEFLFFAVYQKQIRSFLEGQSSWKLRGRTISSIFLPSIREAAADMHVWNEGELTGLTVNKEFQ